MKNWMTHLLMGAICVLITGQVLAQNLYNVNNITTIDITFTDPNWDQTMDANYANGLDERLLATCTVNGVFYDSVGVKYKGNSTYNANNSKNPLNIKLNYTLNQDYAGFSTLKLSSGKNDPSFVREVLSYEIVRKYMVGPMSNYAVVSINGSVYGVFSSSESINGDFQERYLYADDNNTRVKCNPASVFGGNGSSLEYLGTDSTSYYDFYEMSSDFGWQDLIDLTNNIENNAVGIETHLDMDRAIWMCAFDNVMVNLDSYIGPFRQNYYLIKDNNDRMNPLIWDLNESIGGFEMVNSGGGGGPGGGQLTDLTEMDPYIRTGDADWPLLQVIYNNPTYKRMYIAHCRTILEENISNGWYSARADSLQDIIGAEVAADPNAIYSAADFANNINSQIGGGPGLTYGITQLMDARSTYLQGHSAFTAVPPTISAITPSTTAPLPNVTIDFTATISNATSATLAYRFAAGDIFAKETLFDDGAHNDGAAGDGVYGAAVSSLGYNMEYYVYAENNDAGIFSPERAEHEFYTISSSTAGVVINEFMASNQGTQDDQDGESDDWIELYNNSAVTVNLNGYFLSDDNADLTQYALPDTSIAPGGYLIIWADNDVAQTGLHANFKLTASGENIFFSDANGAVLDQITYPTQQTDIAYGRFPNGVGGFDYLYPTFQAQNSTPVAIEEATENALDALLVYPNPANSFVKLDAGNDFRGTFTVVDLQGRIQYSGQVNGQALIDVSAWSKGLYFVVLDNGTSTKLLVH